ncbi:MAG: DUF6502 family protein [Burkholderiales bacterium]
MDWNRSMADTSAMADPAVTRAVGRVLRPLVRLLLDHGITLPTLVEMLKATYMRVAREDFRDSGRELNDSRASVLTGMHRKDVKRLRDAPPPESAPPMSVSVGGQIIAKWTARPEFLDSRSRPRRLPRLRRNGGARSFEALAESVSTDVGPRAILEELLRLGIVRIDLRDHVCLETSAFVPRQGLEEKAYYFGKNLHDHLAAAAGNLRGETPQLERSVHYVALSEESVKRLVQLAEAAGMGALKAINRRASELKQRDRKKGKGNRSITFGVYFHAAPDQSAGETRGRRRRDNDDTGR